MKRLAVLSLTALALTCSSVWQANAENYMYLFDGTVTSSTYTGIDPGNPLTGWFAYANDIPLDSEVPGRARYLTESAGELGASVTIGDTTFDSSNAHGVEITVHNDFDIPQYDAFEYAALKQQSVVNYVSIALTDSSHTAFENTDIPTTLELSQFDIDGRTGSVFAMNVYQLTEYDIDFTIKSMTLVPEPSTLILFTTAALGLLYCALRRRR